MCNSSLLFIISTIKALYVSKLILWKVFNILLIISSYLCNSFNVVDKNIILFDYLAIFLVCISYLNNMKINVILIALLIYEYYKFSTISSTKTITFVLTILTSIVYTYIYTSPLYYNIISLSFILGIFIYKIRDLFYQHNIYKYNIELTYVWHICVLNILYISSFTAV